MRISSTSLQSEADRIFDDGMEYWWKGDVAAACRLFRRALRCDPRHADAHNHLGVDLMERGRLKEAEKRFQAAIQGGECALVSDKELVEWGRIENRPYLRALANLALLLRRERRYEEALELHEKVLALNPNDNQGIRWLLGEDYHRLGRLEEAIAAYKKALEEPGVCHSLALALFQTREEKKAGVALLRGFAANQYIAPMLLGERWEKVNGWHGTNTAEPEWATDYVKEQGDLWRNVPESAKMLRRWWFAGPVQEWRSHLDNLMVQLASLEPGSERSLVVRQQFQLESEESIRELARRVESDPSRGVECD